VTTRSSTTTVPRRSGLRGRPARRAPELAPLALAELRAYRQDLIQEETRVSYWRRILQARLDLADSDERSVDRLRAVLTEHRADSRRLANSSLDGAVGTPPFPDLATLWDAELDDSADLRRRIAAAERELSSYRRDLHRRIDAATGELISRYRDQPALVQYALPLPREQARIA
jgi:hypothetical protein